MKTKKVEEVKVRHASDGHARKATAADIKIGTIVRRYESDGGLSTFADTTVIGIRVVNSKTKLETWHQCAIGLDQLPGEVTGWKADASVYVTLARPYLYADTIGCCPNWLQGVEKYDVTLEAVLDHYSVVEQSTGEVAVWNRDRSV